MHAWHLIVCRKTHRGEAKLHRVEYWRSSLSSRNSWGGDHSSYCIVNAPPKWFISLRRGCSLSAKNTQTDKRRKDPGKSQKKCYIFLCSTSTTDTIFEYTLNLSAAYGVRSPGSISLFLCCFIALLPKQ